MDTDEPVAQDRRRSGKGCSGGVVLAVAAAGQGGSVAAEGEHGQGD
jgi:hypothetical protein